MSVEHHFHTNRVHIRREWTTKTTFLLVMPRMGCQETLQQSQKFLCTFPPTFSATFDSFLLRRHGVEGSKSEAVALAAVEERQRQPCGKDAGVGVGAPGPDVVHCPCGRDEGMGQPGSREHPQDASAGVSGRRGVGKAAGPLRGSRML
eukprot:scaffold6_cov245-Pinguiococcus_pyrenoidosus.AAC.15